MIRRRQKSCKEGVCSIQCFPHTKRCCACFSDYVHTSMIQGYLYSGVCTFGALQPTANFSKNWRGTYFRRGTYLRGFTVVELVLWHVDLHVDVFDQAPPSNSKSVKAMKAPSTPVDLHPSDKNLTITTLVMSPLPSPPPPSHINTYCSFHSFLHL